VAAPAAAWWPQPTRCWILPVEWHLYVCEVMGGGWSFAFTLIPRTGVQGHTNSLHRTHMGCLTWTVRAQVL
jgi:hypothetical protein